MPRQLALEMSWDAVCAAAGTRDVYKLLRRPPGDELEVAAVVRGVGALRAPTIAAVHGAAVGAGLNLVLATDLRVVAHDARLLGGFQRIGLHPGGGNITGGAEELVDGLAERLAADCPELVGLVHSVNDGVADYERLQMLVIAKEPWSIENGCLTPTMKIKRSRIEAAVAEADGELAWALAHLAVRQRQVVVLRYAEDLPVEQVAAILKLTGDWGKFTGKGDTESKVLPVEPKPVFEVNASKKPVLRPKTEKAVETPAEAPADEAAEAETTEA